MSRRRVLFVGEGATLAHAARPLALAAALPSERFEAVLALPEAYRRWVPDHLAFTTLEAQSPEAFAGRVASGRPLYSQARLEAYIRHDLELLAQTTPDVVVGDFRLSLAASARAAGVPYIALTNAYWRPEGPLDPPRPAVRRFRGWPAPLAEAVFRLALPMALSWQAGHLHRALIPHGVDIKGDIRRAFTEADLTLFADIPDLFAEVTETPRMRFLGPVAWEPPASLPEWWDKVPADRPAAYLALGSSGSADLLKHIAAWLIEMGYAVMVATAGRADLAGDSEALFVADYLPGSAACARAEIVVCNGGSPAATQALMAGRPVLGVCANIDQFLNMRAVEAKGAGLMLRADCLSRRAVHRAVTRLREPRFAAAAIALKDAAAVLDPAATLADAIDALVEPLADRLSS
jgi:UDP:flavonoid glycosyltransferase YjiC (YdhE family)